MSLFRISVLNEAEWVRWCDDCGGFVAYVFKPRDGIFHTYPDRCRVCAEKKRGTG